MHLLVFPDGHVSSGRQDRNPADYHLHLEISYSDIVQIVWGQFLISMLRKIPLENS